MVFVQSKESLEFFNLFFIKKYQFTRQFFKTSIYKIIYYCQIVIFPSLFILTEKVPQKIQFNFYGH